MRVQRLTFSAPHELTEAIKHLADAQRMSVSAWLTRAAAAQVRNQRLSSAMDEWEVHHGTLTRDQLAAADRSLDDAAARTR